MDDASLSGLLARNLAHVRAHIAAACARVGRDPAGVTLIAVTKYHNARVADALARTGVEDIGENRLQSALPKFAAMETAPHAHFIGPLQSNKARGVLEIFDVIHSLDRLTLARDIQKRAPALGLASVPCFVEVNVSGEGNKSGFAPEALMAALRDMSASAPLIGLMGLMTIAPLSDDSEAARPHFRRLRILRDEAEARGLLPTGAGLSMGMSGDFEIAVEEGATHVRVGSALYKGIPAQCGK